MINYELLESRIDEYAQKFREAKPHRHLIIDGFLDPKVAMQAYQVQGQRISNGIDKT